jgi:hypothetical protein
METINLKHLTEAERAELAAEVNAVLAQRNEVQYFTTRQKAAAGLEAARSFETAHGRPETQLSLGKISRYHVVFINRVEVA